MRRFDRPLVVRIRDKAAASKGRRFGNYVKAVLSLLFRMGRCGEIATRRAKAGEPVFWPMPRPLADIFDKTPTHAVTLCANSRGHPWTLNGFRAAWRTLRILLEKVRILLEKKGRIGSALTLYGLWHTVAVILRESGCDGRTIADALGQKTIEMARHYAKGADLTKDAQRCEKLRCGIGQTANKNCQPGLTKYCVVAEEGLEPPTQGL